MFLSQKGHTMSDSDSIGFGGTGPEEDVDRLATRDDQKVDPLEGMTPELAHELKNRVFD